MSTVCNICGNKKITHQLKYEKDTVLYGMSHQEYFEYCSKCGKDVIKILKGLEIKKVKR